MGDLDVNSETAVRDMKKMVAENCDIEPENMRVIYKDRAYKDGETIDFDDSAVNILYTAGHTGLCGGSKPPSKMGRNPFETPVRVTPVPKGRDVRACQADSVAWVLSANTES